MLESGLVILALITLDYFLIRAVRRSFKKAALLKNTPTTDIGSLSEPFAEVKGRVAIQSKKLTSPLGGVSCVYYHFTVGEDNFGSEGSVTVVDDSQSVDCYLKDPLRSYSPTQRQTPPTRSQGYHTPSRRWLKAQGS